MPRFAGGGKHGHRYSGPTYDPDAIANSNPSEKFQQAKRQHEEKQAQLRSRIDRDERSGLAKAARRRHKWTVWTETQDPPHAAESARYVYRGMHIFHEEMHDPFTWAPDNPAKHEGKNRYRWLVYINREDDGDDRTPVGRGLFAVDRANNEALETNEKLERDPNVIQVSTMFPPDAGGDPFMQHLIEDRDRKQRIREEMGDR